MDRTTKSSLQEVSCFQLDGEAAYVGYQQYHLRLELNDIQSAAGYHIFAHIVNRFVDDIYWRVGHMYEISKGSNEIKHKQKIFHTIKSYTLVLELLRREMAELASMIA